MKKFKIEELVKTYGTPLLIFDEERFIDHLLELETAFRSTRFKTGIVYASKALSLPYIYDILEYYKYYIDIVSFGEMLTAKASDFNFKHVFFHGNNKSSKELMKAIELGVAYFVIDNYEEWDRLKTIAKTRKEEIKVLIRINPRVEAETHEFIKTATPDSKFGIDIEDNHLIQRIRGERDLNIQGFHIHIGSQIFRKDSFFKAANILLDYYKKLKEQDIILPVINLGGGFGVAYTEKDEAFSLADFLKDYVLFLEHEIKNKDLAIKEIYIEPGRSLINDYMNTVYEIGTKKRVPGKNYLFIDGGMGDNIRPALYGAEYTAITDPKRPNDKMDFTIGGKFCESSDILIDRISLPDPETGDRLMVLGTGAYTYAMASNYNRFLKPMIISVHDDIHTMVERQSIEDLLKGENHWKIR